MGNISAGEVLGHTITQCGCIEHVGFDKSAEAVIRSADIAPWPAKSLIRERLERQVALSKTSPLRYIDVRDGLTHFGDKVKGMMGMKKDTFMRTAKNLCETKHVTCSHNEQDILEEVFDSIDYDGSGTLMLGEWAGGLTVFFKGTQDEKTQALFELLDRDGNGNLSKGEMKEYLTPLVKAMTPPEAAALRPLLVQHCLDEIFETVDLNHDEKVASQEFMQWRRDNSVVDQLVHVLEAEVYKIWLENKMKHPDHHDDHHGDAVPNSARHSIFG